MGANFTPDFQGYTSMKPFRFWCQKVLPTVYDDSLSYYEVLCKLVKYLNTVIENMEKVEANTDALLEAYVKLQKWVNDYFDNLDVQDEIDHKIDEMVEDGTFDRWIEPIIEGYEGDLQALLNQYAGDAEEYVKSAEAWAKGTKNGVPVTSDEPQYQNNSKYWAEQSGDNAEDAEAWAKGTKGGVPVTSDEPQYENSSKYWAEQAQQSAGGAGGHDEDAEAWAVGTKGGVPVTSDEPQYENSSKYWAEQAQQSAGGDIFAISNEYFDSKTVGGYTGWGYRYAEADGNCIVYVSISMEEIGSEELGSLAVSIAKVTNGVTVEYAIAIEDSTTDPNRPESVETSAFIKLAAGEKVRLGCFLHIDNTGTPVRTADANLLSIGATLTIDANYVQTV